MADDYFKNPNTVYEKFINKKWVEREDIMQSKKSFIIEVSINQLYISTKYPVRSSTCYK